MNIACIPYHDWRKIEAEGARTRDSHFIYHLGERKDIDNVLIINRPITYTELLLKKKKKHISGDIIYSGESFKIYKVKNNVYVLDYFSSDLFGPIRDGKAWFFKAFTEKKFINGYLESLGVLDIKIDLIFTQNVFSASFIRNVKEKAIFDAWDNFILFPENFKYRNFFFQAYSTMAKDADIWITNSQKNIEYYSKNYQPKECVLIKNGVDIERFKQVYPVPSDLACLPKPVIGFGGKVTHLFDYELFNYVVEKNSDKTFVIVGQILDKEVFKKISKKNNLFYLGDKHYDDYCRYVTNFDMGIIPYVTNQLEHGADSIKMYEYLASGLPVVGTLGAGISDMSEFVSVAKDKTEFSKFVRDNIDSKKSFSLPEIHTWNYKASEVVSLFDKLAVRP